jgi:hypothetical protein
MNEFSLGKYVSHFRAWIHIPSSSANFCLVIHCLDIKRIDTTVTIRANQTAFRINIDFTACAEALKSGLWPRGGGIKGISPIGTPGGNFIDMAAESRREELSEI